MFFLGKSAQPQGQQDQYPKAKERKITPSTQAWMEVLNPQENR